MVSNEDQNNQFNEKQLNDKKKTDHLKTGADSHSKPTEDEMLAKQQEGYEHVSEGAVNKDHRGEIGPKDIPPSLGGEAEINFPWDEEQPTVDEPDPDSEPLTDDGKIPEPPGKTADTDFAVPAKPGKTALSAKSEEADLPATSDEAQVPATTEEADLPAEPETQTPEEAAKIYQKSEKPLAELSFIKVFYPKGPEKETKIFTREELATTTFAKPDGETTIVAGAAGAAESAEKLEQDQPKNRKEARKRRKEERKQNPKGPIRFIPVWLRLLIVIALCVAGLIIGLMLGYGFIGEGENPQDVLKLEFWQEIIDYIQGE